MDDYSLLCPICIETFRSPRLIKECGHSFCEQCLFTFLTTLKDKGKLGSIFLCPICQQEVTIPSDTGFPLPWTQAFPVDEKLIKKLPSVQAEGEGEQESSVILCDPCTAEDEHNRAVKYCVNCQEYLCKNCVGAHRKYKILHDHSLSGISGNMSTNKVKELVSIKCEKHPDRDVEIYCQSHNMYCCIICATPDHRECSGLTEVAGMEAVAITKLIDFIPKIGLAEKHIDELLFMQKKNIPELLRNKEKITEGLKRMRNQIISEIDDIIDNFDAQIKQQLIVLNPESDTHIENIYALKVQCQKNKETIETVEAYGLPAHKVISQTKIAEEYYKLKDDIIGEEKTIEKLEFNYGGIERLEIIHKHLIKCKQEQVNLVRNTRDFMKYEDVVSETRSKNVVGKEHNYIRLVPDRSLTHMDSSDSRYTFNPV